MPLSNDYPAAGLFRRLAACTYDGLLVIAVFVIPASVFMAFRGGEPIPPGLPREEAEARVIEAINALNRD